MTLKFIVYKTKIRQGVFFSCTHAFGDAANFDA